MIAYVVQERPSFCFLACLESFLAEQGELVSQQTILKKTPEIFGGNENDLGSFSDENLAKIEVAWDLKAVPFTDTFKITQKESVFILCHWEGKSDTPHWMRLLGTDTNFVYLMDPSCDHCPRKIEIPKFMSWWRVLYIMKKNEVRRPHS